MELGDVDVLVVDLDGVLWLGGRIVESNVKALRRFQEFLEVLYVTNNSTRSRVEYARRLESLGLKAGVDRVVTSGRAAALWLRRYTSVSRVYVVGEEGLRWELEIEGFKVVERGLEAEAVVVGLDRGLTYSKLSEALQAINRGAYFVATNLDPTLPDGETLIPGAGAIVAALRVASGREPDVVAGKPNPWILTSTLKDVDYSRVAVVGDRIDTDVELALRIGAKPVLVLTGVTKSLDMETERRLREAGVVIVRSLEELSIRTH